MGSQVLLLRRRERIDDAIAKYIEEQELEFGDDFKVEGEAAEKERPTPRSPPASSGKTTPASAGTKRLPVAT